VRSCWELGAAHRDEPGRDREPRPEDTAPSPGGARLPPDAAVALGLEQAGWRGMWRPQEPARDTEASGAHRRGMRSPRSSSTARHAVALGDSADRGHRRSSTDDAGPGGLRALLDGEADKRQRRVPSTSPGVRRPGYVGQHEDREEKKKLNEKIK
jgi:hypothetical protein